MEFKLGNYTVAIDGWGKSKKHKDGVYMFPTGKTNKEQCDGKHKIDTINRSNSNGFYSDVVSDLDENENKINSMIPNIWLYGQDSMGILHNDGYLIVANADGHGGTKPLAREGADFAYYAVLFSIMETAKHITHIKQLYRNKPELDGFLNDLFQKLDNFLLYEYPETAGYIFGGATLTLNIKFLDKNRLVSVISNTGDSIFMRINGNQIIEETCELNCDTLENYNKYIDKCNELGCLPKKIYLGRFNLPSKFKVTWVHKKSDFPLKPIIPFSLILDEKTRKYRAEDNLEQMNTFYCDAPSKFYKEYLMKGGTQSIRGMEKNRGLINSGRYPASNFGNTAEGLCQCLPGCSIGDRDQKHNRKDMMITNTKVSFYNKSTEEIIGSDGFFDAMPDKDIIENIGGTIQEKKENLIRCMFNNASKHNWGIGWDDITFGIIRVTNNKTQPRNKFRTKRENRRRRNRYK